jgi:GNAT superfamily N-acetyltransferase
LAEILITLERDLTLPIAEPVFPKQYALVNVTENCRRLWERFMDECFGGYQAGSFRYVYVNNNFYEEDRVYVLLNERNEPIGTGNSWQTPGNDGYISWVGVAPAYRGRSLGAHLTNYCLRDMKRRGLTTAMINTEKDNFPALGTYLKCGFVPSPRSEEDVAHWAEIRKRLPMPALACGQTIRPDLDIPHPPRPWPYQLAREKAARANGDLFVHGLWNRFNMYEADKTEYAKLQKLVSDDPVARRWLDRLRDDADGRIYIDCDVNPQAALFTNGEESHRVGVSKDGCFEDGLILFH